MSAANFGLGDEFALLSVGRLDPRERHKGHDRVVAALSELSAQDGGPVVFLIAGDGALLGYDDVRRFADHDVSLQPLNVRMDSFGCRAPADQRAHMPAQAGSVEALGGGASLSGLTARPTTCWRSIRWSSVTARRRSSLTPGGSTLSLIALGAANRGLGVVAGLLRGDRHGRRSLASAGARRSDPPRRWTSTRSGRREGRSPSPRCPRGVGVPDALFRRRGEGGVDDALEGLDALRRETNPENGAGGSPQGYDSQGFWPLLRPPWRQMRASRVNFRRLTCAPRWQPSPWPPYVAW